MVYHCKTTLPKPDILRRAQAACYWEAEGIPHAGAVQTDPASEWTLPRGGAQPQERAAEAQSDQQASEQRVRSDRAGPHARRVDRGSEEHAVRELAQVQHCQGETETGEEI